MSEGTDAARRQVPSEQEVMDFLQQNPDFFQRFPKALDFISIPHQVGDPIAGTVSLVERQVAHLQQEKRNLQERLQILLGLANQNDQIIRNLHLLTVQLLQGKDLEETLNTLYARLREDFQVVPALRICAGPTAPEREEFISPEPMLEELLRDQETICRPLDASKRDFLFGAQGADLASFAVIPLGTDDGSAGRRWRGVLCLGSPDAQRFSVDTGCDFLSNLGGVLTALLTARLS